jgi:hypothetical protein
MKTIKAFIFFLIIILFLQLQSCDSGKNNFQAGSKEKKTKKGKKSKQVLKKDKADEFLSIHLEYLKNISIADSMNFIKIKKSYSRLDSLNWKIDKSREDSILIGFLNKELDSLLSIRRDNFKLKDFRQKLITSREFKDVYYFLKNPSLFYNLDSLRKANKLLKLRSEDIDEKQRQMEDVIFKEKINSLNLRLKELKQENSQPSLPMTGKYDEYENTIDELNKIIKTQEEILNKNKIN